MGIFNSDNSIQAKLEDLNNSMNQKLLKIGIE